MYDPACAECGKPIKFALIVLLCDSCLLNLSVNIKESKRVFPELPQPVMVCLEQVLGKEAVTDCGASLPCSIHTKELRHA